MLRPACELSPPSRDGGGQPVAHRASRAARRATRAVPGIQAQSGAGLPQGAQGIGQRQGLGAVLFRQLFAIGAAHQRGVQVARLGQAQRPL